MRQNIRTIIAVAIACLLMFGAWFFAGGPAAVPRRSDDAQTHVGSAIIKEGMQYVDIAVRAGYTPRVTKAQAGIPTVIRFATENTFDCSSSVVIPDLDIQTRLETTGIREIEVPVEKTQGTLRGMCSMAMYHFEIVFE